jgi:Amt family ammonium transporter
MGGWLALAAVLLLGRAVAAIAMGGWWRSRRRAFLPGAGLVDPDHRLVRLQRDERPDPAGVSGLVAINSLMAMVGGTPSALLAGATTRASCTTARWPGWWRSAPVPT